MKKFMELETPTISINISNNINIVQRKSNMLIAQAM